MILHNHCRLLSQSYAASANTTEFSHKFGECIDIVPIVSPPPTGPAQNPTELAPVVHIGAGRAGGGAGAGAGGRLTVELAAVVCCATTADSIGAGVWTGGTKTTNDVQSAADAEPGLEVVRAGQSVGAVLPAGQ